MNKNTKIGIGIVALLLGFYVGVLSVRVGPVELGGSSTTDTFTRHASSTQFALAAGGAVVQITATSSCSSRIITTGANGAGLSFNDQIMTNNIGHWQAASTTAVYDGSLYGCGVMRARANGATSLLVTEEN